MTVPAIAAVTILLRRVMGHEASALGAAMPRSQPSRMRKRRSRGLPVPPMTRMVLLVVFGSNTYFSCRIV
jgi:hypothetical protein